MHMASKLLGRFTDGKRAELIADEAAARAERAAKALIPAEQRGMRRKTVKHFWLAPAQRQILMRVPGLSKMMRSKLASKTSSFLVTEVASMTMALAAELPNGEAPKQLAVLLVAKHLVERLQEGIIESAEPRDSEGKKPKIKAGTRTLFQLKITLKGTKQPIWRR